MNAVAWKLNRLSLMSPPEIAWRAGKALRARWERIAAPLYEPAPRAAEGFGKPWVGQLPCDLDAGPYLRAADQVLAGRFDLFALKQVELGFPPRWNRDPKTGIDAPLDFGKLLDYRNERVVGDIKYLWELNRHYELVTLAQAFLFSGRRDYADACLLLLESWFEQCRFPFGQAWSSALENAIRLANWAVAWHLLDAGGYWALEDGSARCGRERWLDSIYCHCRFVAGHLSLHSSANNHLAGEYMGLFIGALTWPCWNESAQWADTSGKGLEREALKQNAPDGVNREQGIWYHHEVADMMLLAGLFGRASGFTFSDAYWSRLEAMLEFVQAVMDAGGNVPMIGDADDAVMVRFSQAPAFDAYRSLLATGAVLFKRADFKKKSGGFDDKSRWLLGGQGAAAFAALEAEAPHPPLRRAFADGGYYVLGQDFDTPREIKVVVDAGPLGYLSIAAHGHADALAFTLSVGGRPLLIDPGTYAYHTQKKWRAYFRGTSAHNTVRVDGLDQSAPGGNFMWLAKANVRCESWLPGPDTDFFCGSHDGYMRLPDPVLHRRRISWNKLEQVLRVEDRLECRKQHRVEYFWHFSDACQVMLNGRTAQIRTGNACVEMAMLGVNGAPELVKGREQPPLGWISRRFDERTPSPSIVWHDDARGDTERVTLFRIRMDGTS